MPPVSGNGIVDQISYCPNYHLDSTRLQSQLVFDIISLWIAIYHNYGSKMACRFHGRTSPAPSPSSLLHFANVPLPAAFDDCNQASSCTLAVRTASNSACIGTSRQSPAAYRVLRSATGMSVQTLLSVELTFGISRVHPTSETPDLSPHAGRHFLLSSLLSSPGLQAPLTLNPRLG
jgi:hypothetical protein